jgi:hypothetical protein
VISKENIDDYLSMAFSSFYIFDDDEDEDVSGDADESVDNDADKDIDEGVDEDTDEDIDEDADEDVYEGIKRMMMMMMRIWMM